MMFPRAILLLSVADSLAARHFSSFIKISIRVSSVGSVQAEGSAAQGTESTEDTLMDVLMDNDFLGFVGELLGAGGWQHRFEVLLEETLKVEREQKGAKQNAGGTQQPYLWPRKTKPASLNHLNLMSVWYVIDS